MPEKTDTTTRAEQARVFADDRRVGDLAELQLKAEELKRKEMDSQRDFQIAQGKRQLEQARLALEAQRKQGEDPRLATIRAQQDMTHKEQVHQQKMRQQAQSAALKARQQRMNPPPTPKQ